jgi:hypothetical protein
MSDDMMLKRWSVGNYDGYMVEWDGGDYVEAEDVEPLLAEITRLRARVEVLERACRLIEGDPDPHAVAECIGCYRHSRLAYHALEAKPCA